MSSQLTSESVLSSPSYRVSIQTRAPHLPMPNNILVKLLTHNDYRTEEHTFPVGLVDTWNKLMEALQCVYPIQIDDPEPRIFIKDETDAFKIHPRFWSHVVTTHRTFYVACDTTSPSQLASDEDPDRSMVLSINFCYNEGIFALPLGRLRFYVPQTFTFSTIAQVVETELSEPKNKPLIPFKVALFSSAAWDENMMLGQLGIEDEHYLVYEILPRDKAVPELMM